MAVFTEHTKDRCTGEFRPFRAAIAWLALVTMLCLPGCRGCHKAPDADDAEELERQQAEEKAKKKEKEKEPFEARMPAAMPTGPSFAGSCKPGHWISQVWPEVKSNRGDFQGEMQTEVVDRNDHKVPLNKVPYEIVNSRPAALAKEQPKSLESFTWIPPRQDPPRQDYAVSVDFKLAAGEGGPAVIERSMSLMPMPSYRYYFVVLSKAAGRYDYLKKLGSIHLGRANADDDAGPKYYEVVSMPGARRPSLPTNALYWTSIAYLLWDDFDPAQCDVDQQRALVDWLHWGGQVIVSGPDALEQLRNSFLRPYLPATVEKSRTFSRQDLAELSYWAGEVGFPPKPVKPWPGAVLKTDPKDRLVHYLPYTGDLLVERQVGRGRIVVSAFRLTGPELTGWAGFDCLFNACLLRRSARVFSADPDLPKTQFHWAGSKANSSRRDAAKMTAVRYFVRDTGVDFEKYAADVVAARKESAEWGDTGNTFPMTQGAIGNGENDSDSSDDDAPIPLNSETPGLGAWNDFSPVAQAARSSLKDAGGIKVPARSFIVWVVVGYLCVLVPANWIVFRLLGRVEWAWVAAPLIAIACTVLVIHEAQVNIGFARSRNEIAVIEMQPGYPRAHVARYNVLYTSLSTRYEFRLADPGGQILPFPGAENFEMPLWQTPGELVCRRGEDMQLTGFNVASNADDSMHSEEMADFGGTLNLLHDSEGRLHVTNGTTYTLNDCRAVRGGPSGANLARIGRLEPGASTVLIFDDRRRKAAARNLADTPVPSGELRVEAIADVALDRQELRSGEICLLALVDGNLPGLTVIPEAGQVRQASLLVAHLDAGQLDDPQADVQESKRRIKAKVQTAESAPPGPESQALRPKTLLTMIELINFTKRYNDLLAVDQLNLKIEAGEMFGFIGPNGAGKSTSIRFLATLLKATSGEGVVNGHRVSKDPLAVRRSVGYMPDGFGVYDGMKVWEFLDFFAVAYQLPRARRRQVLNDVMELLDLTGKRDSFVNGLSRGMKQRLCLAKTLVHDPPVLILDEPTSGLDPRARIEVKALFKELRRMGKTILISSHILTELADCCSSIGIIERGKLLMSGPIDEVYRRIRGNRTVRIRFLENMEAGLAICRSMPETRDVQIEDHHVTLELAADDNQVAGLMEKLVAAGVRMSSFAEKEPTLEDVFMMVTKGAVA